MDLVHYLLNDLITDNTKELSNKKLFLKTAQNSKYAKNIKTYITPKELLNNLNLPTKFIGITGTNGKTTTAFVLSFLLKELGFNVATQGTEGFFYNLEQIEDKTLTTPPILTTIKRAFKYKPDFFVMEVSSHAIAQQRIEGIEFFAKLFTSFSQDHLDFHKSMEEYRKVKESFFHDKAIKVVNGKKIKSEKCKVKVGGYEFEMNCKNLYIVEKPIVENISMAGEFNKMNFSLALKTAQLITNFPFSILYSKLKKFKGVPGRMEIVSKNPLIIIDFAHTPDGIENVLKSINGKKIVVFGAGGERDREKRPLMGRVASENADFVILTNDNPRCEDEKKILKDIEKGLIHKNYLIIPDRKEAIKRGIEIAKKENATLFVLGKGDEKYIQKCKEKIPFSDREVILHLLNS